MAQVCKDMAVQDLDEKDYVQEMVGHDISCQFQVQVSAPSMGDNVMPLGSVQDMGYQGSGMEKDCSLQQQSMAVDF